ncbi:MAG TPA: hypothetical protein VGJ26_16570 [Pirellulales bacterium]|jgi:hypothetical protein
MSHAMRLPACLIVTGILTAGATFAPAVHSQEKSETKLPKTFVIGDAYKMTAPEGWVAKQPRTKIVEHEFAVPAVKGDELDGRVTVMGAGGSVEANIERWHKQFTQPDGSNTKDKAKLEKKKIAGQDVTIVDISGTYMDSPGPQAPGVERKDYRMLAAIVQTKSGNAFIKFYGPQKTVTENASAFNKMLESLQSSK